MSLQAMWEVVELTGSLLFRCPACATTQWVPLVAVPRPPEHPERAAPWPPLTVDDLIDLHLLLHREAADSEWPGLSSREGPMRLPQVVRDGP